MPTVVCIVGPPGTHKKDLLSKIAKTHFERKTVCYFAPFCTDTGTFEDYNKLYSHYVETVKRIEKLDDRETVIFIEGSPFDVSAYLLMNELQGDEVDALNELAYFMAFKNDVYKSAIYVELKVELSTIIFRTNLEEQIAIKMCDLYTNYYNDFLITIEDAGNQVLILNDDEPLVNFVYYPLIVQLGVEILKEEKRFSNDCLSQLLKFISWLE